MLSFIFFMFLNFLFYFLYFFLNYNLTKFYFFSYFYKISLSISVIELDDKFNETKIILFLIAFTIINSVLLFHILLFDKFNTDIFF